LVRNRLEYWDVSEAEIDRIEKTGQARRTMLLKSLLSGVVTHKAVVEGDKVGPGMDLFHIADLDKIWVEASVYESELPLIEVGQTVELELDHLVRGKLEGKVDFIYPYLDQKSRANSIRLVFDNPDLFLKPDMHATVRIHSHVARDSLAIPSESVIHSGKRKIVFVTKGDGKFEPREIKMGVESADGYVQVVSGLFDHEKVVVSGQFLLDSESRTREAIAKMREAQTQRVQEISEEKKRGEVESPEMAAEKLYACPMHPEFITSDPEARCPECGMDVVPVEDLRDKVALEKAVFYTCPMHPDFLTTDKDARCPECGMMLEEVKKK
jgi:Cu(I)/Ag(I) efflux system membrane fusion protein/cobalt-zinc-cadmium efflux system membrane fusion protein